MFAGFPNQSPVLTMTLSGDSKRLTFHTFEPESHKWFSFVPLESHFYHFNKWPVGLLDINAGGFARLQLAEP